MVSNIMIPCLAFCALLLALSFPAHAQQTKKVPRIGYLTLTVSSSSRETFLEGLRDLGYIEGQNIVIEYRHAAGRAERLPDLAAELVRLKVVPPPIASAYRKQIVDFAAKNQMPAMYENSEVVERGGLMSYGANRADLDRRAAIYVDKILKGAKPADLPVEQPTKFEFAINLKTAKQIGLTIPPNVLTRADKVIR